MAINYDRKSDVQIVEPQNLRYGRFYRVATDTRPEPVIYIATDENTVVTMTGIQYNRNYGGNSYVEVNVDITVRGDL